MTKRSTLIGIVSVGLFTISTAAHAESFWHKTWHEVGNGLKDVNTAAIKVGKGAEHLGQEIGKTGDKFGKEVSKGFCDVMTLGQYSQGKAGCGVSAGVGHDSQGTYTYDPANPNEKYRGAPADRNNGPSDQQLSEFARNLEKSQIRTWEYEDQDVYGIRRFLLPNTTIGEAWPNAVKELKPPTKTGLVRPCCEGGAGEFLATRNDHGQLRFHAGVDYITHVGEPIYAPMTGWVERQKNPGRPGLTGLLITNDKGYTASLYYVEPTKEVQKALQTPTEDGITKNRYRVTAGKTVVGYSQNLHPAYPADVPQHVHVTLTDPSGNPVAPDGRSRINKTPPQVVEAAPPTPAQQQGEKK